LIFTVKITRLYYLIMCIICSKSYSKNTISVTTCTEVKEIPRLPRLEVLVVKSPYITAIPRYLTSLYSITCSDTNVEHIPYLPLLRILDCSNSKLKEIPAVPGLTHVYCNNTPVSEIPEVKDIKVLKCSRTLITRVPSNLKHLITLVVSETKVSDIPFFPLLGRLAFRHTNVTKIPYFPCLFELDCSGTLISELNVPHTLRGLICEECPNITAIPYIEHLFILDITSSRCITSVDSFPIISTTNGCVWLNPVETRLQKLILIQKRIRAWIKIKKFVCRMKLVKRLPLVLINNVFEYL
jgi:hypothetical protein